MAKMAVLGFANALQSEASRMKLVRTHGRPCCDNAMQLAPAHVKRAHPWAWFAPRIGSLTQCRIGSLSADMACAHCDATGRPGQLSRTPGSYTHDG